MARMTWSRSLDTCVEAGFTFRGTHYEWNDFDCLYYSDDSDEDYFMEIPRKAVVDMY